MNLAVGFFDGVHAGHRRILKDADVALTFRNHPATVFAPARAPYLLMTCETRLATISRTLRTQGDSDNVRALDFTKELAGQTPEQFAGWLRREYPDLEKIFCGGNWTFGCGGTGTPDFLHSLGFDVEVVPYVVSQGTRISSTCIRTAISHGEIPVANAMMGRPWQIEGTTSAGKGIARKMGFPTINIIPDAELVRPPNGVYAVRTQFGSGIANYGTAPTFGKDAWERSVLELHLFADGIDVAPGSRMVVDVLKYVRPEKRFESLDELRTQIAKDIVECKDFIRRNK